MTVDWKNFKKEEGRILYGDHIKIANSIGVSISDANGNLTYVMRPRMRVIKHEDLQLYNFDRGFMEFVMDSVDNVRLYFDFDKVADENEYLDVVRWLDSLVPVFGPYSLGGYTNNEDFAKKYGYKHYPDCKHFVSAHVIYYTTKINVDELMKIMRHNIKVGFTNYDIHPACDPHVYKLRTRQCFRHIMSDKIYMKHKRMKGLGEDSDWFSTAHSTENVNNRGYILNGLGPETVVITPDGSEKLVPKEEWMKVFHPVDKVCLQYKSPKLFEKIIIIMNMSTVENPILFTKEEMLEILSYFEPNFNCLLRTLRSLRRSPYTIEFLFDTLYEWFSKVKHAQPAANSVSGLLDSYYRYDPSTNWLKYLLPYVNVQVSGVDNESIERENAENKPIEHEDVKNMTEEQKKQTRPANKHVALRYAMKLGLIEHIDRIPPQYLEDNGKCGDDCDDE